MFGFYDEMSSPKIETDSNSSYVTICTLATDRHLNALSMYRTHEIGDSIISTLVHVYYISICIPNERHLRTLRDELDTTVPLAKRHRFVYKINFSRSVCFN